MIRVQRGNGAWLPLTVLDGEQETAADAAPSVALTGWDGAAVETVTAEAVDGGRYRALMSAVDQITANTATWTYTVDSVAKTTVDRVEIVEGFYFELNDLRAMPDIDDTDAYSTADLGRARQWAETKIDEAITVPVLERFRTRSIPLEAVSFVLVGWGLSLRDPYARTLVGVTVDDTPVDLETLTVRGRGVVTNTNVWPLGTEVTIAYTSGFSDFVPDDIRTAALIAARYWLLSTVGHSGIPDRTRSISTSEGTQTLSVAGQYSPIGIPDVDVVLNSYFDKIYVPGIA